MHPALYSWREELPPTLVRFLAYLGGIAVLSIVAAQVFQSPPVMRPIAPVRHSQWIEIERPFPAFALSIPEAVDVPSSYAIRRHGDSGGRKDILALGEPDGLGPYLQVEIYRLGGETRGVDAPKVAIVESAAALGPVDSGRGRAAGQQIRSAVDRRLRHRRRRGPALPRLRARL